MFDTMVKASYETLYMVFGTTFFSVILGFIPAIVLVRRADVVHEGRSCLCGGNVFVKHYRDVL